MGMRLACASIMSEAEVRSALITAAVAMHCTVVNLRAVPMEPLDLSSPVSLQMGVNHTSAA